MSYKNKMMQTVLRCYDLDERLATVEPFGSGLINRTWKISTPDGVYILQKINDTVFQKPEDIAYNISLLNTYLKEHAPEYFFAAPLLSTGGKAIVSIDEDFFRLFPFIDSYTKEVVETPGQAYEAAAQFGKFTRLLSGFDAGKLKSTIPRFHDLSLRYDLFLSAIENGSPKRIKEAREWIDRLKAHCSIVSEYEKIKANPLFSLRVTHHDTKISNVLFDSRDKGICVIDLDTVMPGYFISDLGDMMRTYLSPVNEEEKDISKIAVRDEFYKAIVSGYYSEMKDVLTPTEKDYFFYAGMFMIYMQALRFLTDHLNNDVYYGARYEGQNLVRAVNQITLLQRLMEKEEQLSSLSPVLG
jgi:Ser/Thr protein kinase RdoA (MazF antagonist)